MKKVVFLILSCLLVLGACSNGGNKNTTVSENKPQFKNDTLVLDQAVLYIKDAFIIKDKESGNNEIAIKYEVKNKTNKEEITPSSVWTAGVTVKQDEGSTESELDTGMTVVDGGKYKEWLEHYNDTIKKGEKAKGLATYQLKNDNKVVLHFSKGIGGDKLGTKEYDLSKLKTVDYSSNEDLENTYQESSANENNTDNNQSSEVANNTESKDANTNVQSNTQTQGNTNKEQTQQSAPREHSGGHPSAFGGGDVPVGTEKVDDQGESYIDATGE